VTPMLAPRRRLAYLVALVVVLLSIGLAIMMPPLAETPAEGPTVYTDPLGRRLAVVLLGVAIAAAILLLGNRSGPGEGSSGERP